MEEWQQVLQEWYPREINKTYPIKISKQYTSNQRWEIYEKLTKDQRKLVDQHRRYLINSRFMEENYLEATDWVFEDFKINPFFRTKRRQQKLYCDCGRELKVQYVVKSPKTGKQLKLGINHFAEHLHVSPQIATSINQGMTKVDLALDELLWLKQQNIEFPEDLWQEYCFMLYQNRKLKNPYLPDEKLTKRLADFRLAKMPIYIADHQALSHEIKQIEKQITGSTKTLRGKKELFDDFSDALEKDVEAFLHQYKIFLQKDWASISIEGGRKQSIAFFEAFIATLRKTKQMAGRQQKTEIERLAQDQRFIQPAIYLFIWEQYVRYGFSEGFFDSIPRVMRNGFLKVLRKEKKQKSYELQEETVPRPKIVSEKKWEELAQSVKEKGTIPVLKNLEREGYQLSDEQQEALHYYRKIEYVARSDKTEIRRLLKELL
ncbi:hypothetical protein [Enterococcus durans]|uniref:hypothetical protein n=1 Tax=Enterococcus durans TaxID=53345 RepID=UPI000BA84715|nr:hypothetical protein [Enterococcus durans]ASV95573.1 hypothetical protein CJZ72_08380 [Enterococcus durans]